MQSELVRDLGADGDAADAVAVLVETRREDGDAETARKDRDHATAHAALGRQADIVQPAAGIVVHAARRHDAEHGLHFLRRNRALSRQRVHAAIRQRRGHEGEIATGDANGTLPEVILEHRHGIAIDDAEVLQHPGDRAIAKTGLAFRTVHRIVDRDGASKERGDDVGDALPLFRRVVAGDQARHSDCTSIDHGIQWRTGLGIEADRIEGLPARLDAHLAQDALAASIRQSRGVNCRLGHRLHRELAIVVADLIDIAVGGDDADAECIRIGLGELGDVVGYRAGGEASIFFVQRIQVLLEREYGGIHGSRNARRKMRTWSCSASLMPAGTFQPQVDRPNSDIS